MDWVKVIKLASHHGDGQTGKYYADCYRNQLQEKYEQLDEDDPRYLIFLNVVNGNHAGAHSTFRDLEEYYVAFSGLDRASHKDILGFGQDNKVVLKTQSPNFTAGRYNSSYVKNGEGAFDRSVDTEAKILERMYADLCKKGYTKSTAQGTIYIFTYYEPCPSCQQIGQQFQARFPFVEICIYYQTDNNKKAVSAYGTS